MPITPAPTYLTVTEPPIPEEEGLWVPPNMSGAETEVAIVVEAGADVKLPVEAGDRIFFFAQHFAKIADVKLVPEDCVLAFEKR